VAETLSRVDARLTTQAGITRALVSSRLKRRLREACLLLCALISGAALLAPHANAAFDHSHARLDALLSQHVVWISNGGASQIDYSAIKRDPSALKSYLAEVATVTQEQYRAFSKTEKLAFLINAYNAYTIDFVLTGYPNIKSIRDLGSLFSSPWKKRLFPLLGEQRSLDEIEHDMIRKPGDFDDPRIHMAVNCASVGCPALRNEAYVAQRLDAQLDDAVHRFLGDHSRNRADEKGLWVSKIFDWYATDFEKQSGSVAGWLAPHAVQLSDDAKIQAAVKAGTLRVRYLDYDWTLNDLQNPK
jgi:hypothetical protein